MIIFSSDFKLSYISLNCCQSLEIIISSCPRIFSPQSHLQSLGSSWRFQTRPYHFLEPCTNHYNSSSSSSSFIKSNWLLFSCLMAGIPHIYNFQRPHCAYGRFLSFISLFYSASLSLFLVNYLLRLAALPSNLQQLASSLRPMAQLLPNHQFFYYMIASIRC